MSRLLYAALALVTGCKTVASGDVFEEKIEKALADKGKTAEVECPDRIPLGRVENNHFDCVVVQDIDGRRIETPMVVTLDAEANWRMEPRQGGPIDLDPPIDVPAEVE